MATHNLTVHFDANQSPAVTITPKVPVFIPPNELSLITFTLDGPESAKFPSTPIQWQDENQEPVDLPLWFVMHRHGPQHFALWDFNSTPACTTHRFQVSVFSSVDGKTYSTDPTIINEQPVQT